VLNGLAAEQDDKCFPAMGVDSVMTPATRRAEAWARLVRDLPESFFSQSATQIDLEQAPEYAAKIIANQIQGRTLVKIA
jgi:acrylyl-CoA reductase (NADPH)